MGTGERKRDLFNPHNHYSHCRVNETGLEKLNNFLKITQPESDRNRTQTQVYMGAEFSLDPASLIHLSYSSTPNIVCSHFTHLQKTPALPGFSSWSKSTNSSSMTFFLQNNALFICNELGITWSSRTASHISAGAQEGLPKDQGEQVIRLNPLFGSVSFPSRPAIEQSILQTLIHHLGAPNHDGWAGPSAGPTMDVCHSSLQGANGAMSYSGHGTFHPHWDQSQEKDRGRGGWHRPKKTSLGDVPATMGTVCLSHSKVGRCLMEFAAETGSI